MIKLLHDQSIAVDAAVTVVAVVFAVVIAADEIDQT